MLESIVNPKKAERRPWEMFFIGLIYASLAVLLVEWIFAGDPVLVKYSGMILVTFTVMFSLPFMYFVIKLEQEEDETILGYWNVMKAHSDALAAFMWLFLGFIIAFSFWYIMMPSTHLFEAQVSTYCMINSPGSLEDCVAQYNLEKASKTTGAATNFSKTILILENNVYVLMFTLIFSLIFGAGAIFILAWNASVIASAIGIFTRFEITKIPLGIARYMIHGFPEIAAYFIGALAGGMISIGVIKYKFQGEKFWRILQNSIILLVFSLFVLIFAALIEVYVTPYLF